VKAFRFGIVALVFGVTQTLSLLLPWPLPVVALSGTLTGGLCGYIIYRRRLRS
jgi:hypothetical protein